MVQYCNAIMDFIYTGPKFDFVSWESFNWSWASEVEDDQYQHSYRCCHKYLPPEFHPERKKLHTELDIRWWSSDVLLVSKKNLVDQSTWINFWGPPCRTLKLKHDWRESYCTRLLMYCMMWQNVSHSFHSNHYLIDKSNWRTLKFNPSRKKKTKTCLSHPQESKPAKLNLEKTQKL